MFTLTFQRTSSEKNTLSAVRNYYLKYLKNIKKSLKELKVTMIIVKTNYVKSRYSMTYLELLQTFKSKTAKAPSQAYAVVINTQMLR